jgi:hypothetical protein
MRVRVDREIYRSESTIGRLYIDDVYQCRTLEDTVRTGAKVYGKTAIPAGTFPLKLRTEGTTHEDYKVRFAGIHRGTLHIDDIPGYKYVLIHCGNTPEDTLGCLLIGMAYNGGDRIEKSTAAYMKIYPIIAKAIADGDDVEIEVVNT